MIIQSLQKNLIGSRRLSDGLDQYIDWFRENKGHYNYLQSYDI